MKRILIGLAVIVLAPVLALVAMLVVTFSGNKPLVDGVELPGGAHIVKDGYVAAYVLPAGDKDVALIDCGYDEQGAAILEELKRLGFGPDAVKAIFLTHGHPDHTAACHLFRSAAVYAFPAEAPIAAGVARTAGPIPSQMDMPPEKRIRVTHQLKDGEVVNVGSLAVTPYAVIGHTAGSAVYVANGTLFLGDCATGASDGSLKAPPWLFSNDVVQARQSLEALGQRLQAESADVKSMAFGHSGPLDGVDALRSFRASR